MLTREFGRLGVQVSAIGLGTAQLANLDGSVAGIKRVDPADARRIIEEALSSGVSFFDTGDQYGAAEDLLGSLASSTAGRALIATKAGLRDDGIRDFTPDYLRGRLERSLKRLKTERLDLFQLNKPAAADWADGRLAGFLAEEKRRGRIRFAGVVVGEAEDGLRALDEPAVDAVQVLFHLLYCASRPVIAKAAHLGKGVIIRSPLNSGLLSGNYRPEMIIPASDERSRYFQGDNFRYRLNALHAIQTDLNIPNETLIEFALRFCISEPGVSTVIPGASALPQALRYIACGDSGLWPASDMERIRFVISKHTTIAGGAFQFL